MKNLIYNSIFFVFAATITQILVGMTYSSISNKGYSLISEGMPSSWIMIPVTITIILSIGYMHLIYTAGKKLPEHSKETTTMLFYIANLVCCVTFTPLIVFMP